MELEKDKELYTEEELCKDSDDGGFTVKDDILYGYVGEGGEVTLPYGIRQIAAGAFHYAKNPVTRLNLPETVEIIHSSAFLYCEELETISLAALPKKILDPLKDLKSLKLKYHEGIFYLDEEEHPYRIAVRGEAGNNHLALHENTELICPSCFRDCHGLLTVKLNERIKNIPELCFAGCAGLEVIELPEGLLSIDGYALDACTRLKELKLPAGLCRIDYGNDKVLSSLAVTHGDGNSYYPLGDNPYGVLVKLRSPRTFVRVRDGVRIMIGYSMSDCKEVSEVYLPDGFRCFDSGAISLLHHSINIIMPKGVKILNLWGKGQEDFDDSFYIEKGYYTKIGYIFRFEGAEYPEFEISYALNELTIWRGNSAEVVIPEGVEQIGAAFTGRDDITSVTLPQSLKVIGHSAFKGCSGLKGELKIPKSVTRINDDAFLGCKGLKRLYVPKDAYLYDHALRGVGLFKIKKY